MNLYKRFVLGSPAGRPFGWFALVMFVFGIAAAIFNIGISPFIWGFGPSIFVGISNVLACAFLWAVSNPNE